MKKRILSIITVLALCLSMLPAQALAAEPETDDSLCPHHAAHTAECGYTPTDPGQPCGYACRICPVQELIDALPDADSITADNRAEVETRLAGIDAARAGLTDEEAEQLDVTWYQAAVSALSALDGQAGADVPMLTTDIKYLDCNENGQNWTEKTCNNATVVTDSDTAWGADDGAEHWYVVNGEVSNSNRIIVTGDVHLILADGCHLNATVGITVSGSNSLTIYAQSDGASMGKLTAKSSGSGAGIGSGGNSSGGRITINGGTVTATGGQYGAGIGGGNYGAGGTIYINGGTVKATGANNGAGIGGGSNGAGGRITISGGTVMATGGWYGAGIGSGYNGAGGTITISGGTVMATGGDGAAGIGGGDFGTGGTIAISGGTVTAIGANGGAGIGGGRTSPTTGAFSTETDGDALIFASNILGGTVADKSAWSGIIFEGDDGKVYGDSITMTTDAEIPDGKTLTIDEGQTLTIDSGVTLTNNGTIIVKGEIINNGTFAGNGSIQVSVTFAPNGGSVNPESATVTYNSAYGTLPTPARNGYHFDGWFTESTGGNKIEGSTNVTVTKGHILYAHWTENKSAVAVTFSVNPTYGGRLTITATVQAAPASNSLRVAAFNTVDFYLGSAESGDKLGTASVTGNEATWEVTLTGDEWKPGDKKITAVFGGSGDYTGSSGSGTVTIAKATPAVTAPSPVNGLTYTGSAQELISGGSTTPGTMKYSLEKNGTYSTEIPKGTDAKSYTVYYKVEENDYYNEVTGHVDVSIAQKSIAGATVTLGDSLTYTGTQQTQAVTSVTVDSLTVTYTVSNNQQTDAGVYTLTVTGTGNFTGSVTQTFSIAKASNSITALSCENVVFGNTPNPSATASFGTPAFTYSNTEDGPYSTWDTNNSKGTWYVKASVEGTSNYAEAAAVASFSVTAEREPTPNAIINYTDETLTGLTAAASYSITPADGTAVIVTASGSGTINIQADWFGKTLSIVKVARDDNYSDSEAQSLSIPSRPAAPTTPLKLTKTANSITITNAYSGCEFSADGTSWNDAGAFTGLTAGTAYSVQVRVKATASSFRSASMTQAVTTVNGDGSTTIKPGETVTTGGGTTITNDGDKTTIESGGKTTTITPPGDGGTEMNGDGTITVPEGGTVQTGNGPEITVGPGNGGTVDGDGTVTVPEGGTVQIGNNPATTITPPPGGEVKPTDDGGVTVPEGTTVKTGDGPEITVGPGNGGTVGGDGTVTVPEGGTVQIGSNPATTITPPPGGEVKPTDDGGVTVPGGTTVKTGDDGPEITVGPGNGGTIGGDGGVTVPGGGTIQVGDDPTITITLPTGGGTVTPAPGGGVGVPGGSTVTDGDTTTTVPSGGGIVDPDTGDVTLNVHTVTFDSQGGSAVSSQAVAAGGKAVKPSDPARSGYNFGGWYKDSSCTTAWNFDTDVVTGNITLYAKWTAKPTSGGGGGGTYTPPTYPPTVEKPSEGGTVTVSPSRPGKGDKVTVRPKPDDGYEVDKITVIDKDGKPVTVTKNPDGTYSFTQPSGTVKIEVSYKPTGTTPVDTSWVNPFADVSADAWYYDAVRYVNENGLMNGYSSTIFGPNDNLTRAQLAQILFNKESGPVVNYLLQYSDVADGMWYTEAIRWATSQGIVSGYGDGRFGPDDNITREQLAVMLWRYTGSPAATNKELHFNDTDEISGYALDAIRWAVENGILNGYGDGRLDPGGQATRAQVAQMLKNFLDN